MAVLLLVGSWEFARLAALGKFAHALLMVMQAVILALLLYHWNKLAPVSLSLLTAACLSWCLMLLRLISFHTGDAAGLNYRMLSFFCALAAISFAWLALSWLRDQPTGSWLVLLLLIDP